MSCGVFNLKAVVYNLLETMGPSHCIKAVIKTSYTVELVVLLVKRVLDDFKMSALITCGSHFGVKPLGKLRGFDVL